MKRGEVYWANLAPRSGSEQTGKRPVIILSHDAFNQTSGWRSIIVIPVSTSSNQAKLGPTVVPLPAGTAGLPSDCSAICHQITTLDRAKLTDLVGTLPPEALAAIEKALLAAVDIRR
ncbi:MAG TPA: type II toxin-antitoxin system PemK/MazF family toxin [Desulfuromonadales bacterium]|nr:type II toxin-antitoxin system PemK/MazF family toxin [Desulfuromonadales bacterium]